MALSNLFMAWSSNPGAVPLGARPLPNEDEDEENDMAPLKSTTGFEIRKGRKRGIRRCTKCNGNYKPPRAHHDSVTGRCIVKMDHFCPWVGNAVGALNHKFFFLFILYTFCTSFLSLVFLIIHSIRCSFYVSETANEDLSSEVEGKGEKQKVVFFVLRDLLSKDETQYDESYTFAGCSDGSGSLFSPQVVLLLILAITFLVFTCCMLFEQIDAIESNTSKIARLKMRMGLGTEELTRVTSEFNEMFGGSSPKVAWHWFLPFKVRFPDAEGAAKVMGFEYNDEWFGEIYRELHCSSDLSTDENNQLGQSSFEISDGVSNGLEISTVSSGDEVERMKVDDPIIAACKEGDVFSLKGVSGNNEDVKQRGNVKKRKGEGTADRDSMQITLS